MPYILNTQKDIKEMFKAVGVSSFDELYSQLPGQIKLKEPLAIPSSLSELEVKKKIRKLSDKNNPLGKFNSFLGAGCYDHYVPAAVASLLRSPQFLTAYTPYQAECSQGILQAIYEYQTYICLLTGMDVSNASLLDGASALAEAVLMALRVTKRKKVIVAQTLHPEYRKTLETYLSGFDFIIKEVKSGQDGLIDIKALTQALDSDSGCCVLQSPNFFGLIENLEEISAAAKEKGVLTVMSANPLSLALLKEPGSLGVDIVCGDGQSLGGNLNFGGPTFGFLASKSEYLRQMPGRIVGKTQDKEAKPAYCLTLQAREQHIRREKATSNICSNESLNTIGAAIYLSLVGRDGLKQIAQYCFNNTLYLYQRLKEVRGVNILFAPRLFNEFVWEVENALGVYNELYKKGIVAGYCLADAFSQYKNSILSCCTEKKSKADIDNFVNTLGQILHG